MPGSKLRPSSALGMALELALLKLLYQWTGAWAVRGEAQLAGDAALDGAAAKKVQ